MSRHIKNISPRETGKKARILLTGLLMGLLFLPAMVQKARAIEPVTVVVNLAPPYTPFLPEYASSAFNQLQVTLIVNDKQMTNYPARLEMMLEQVGSGVVMKTNQYAGISPLFLSGGITEQLAGLDFAPYFRAANNVFSGIGQDLYIRQNRIPDGQYRIGFRVVDSRRPEVVLSNTAWSQPGWFVLNNPPSLNLPRNHAKQRVDEIQNVTFEWFPRHLGAMNAAFPAKYKLELYTLRVPGIEPNQAVLSLLPDYTEETNSHRIMLGQDKYLLEPGTRYAWRVQATGKEGMTLFSNNGYSEVFSFTYGSTCPTPENNQVDVTGPAEATISWLTDPGHNLFEVHYREHSSSVWHTKESYLDHAVLDKLLLPNGKYEYKLRGKCNTVYSDFTLPETFYTPAPERTDFQCGKEEEQTRVVNFQPKASLKAGDVIHDGQFPLKITEVSGSNGTFSGKGRMKIPFLNNVNVNMQFTDIKVNELNQVYEGELVSIYNPDSKFIMNDPNQYFMAGDQVGKVFTGQSVAAIELDYPVQDVSRLDVQWNNDNTITITGPSGESITKEVSTKTGGTTIKDSQGNMYTVDEKGQVTKVATSQASGGSYAENAASYNQLNTEASIVFENNDKDYWAFDAYDEAYLESNQIINQYEDIEGYKVPWKLVPAGKSGKVIAKVASGAIDKDKVFFSTPAGTVYQSNLQGGEYHITVIAAKHGDAQELYARYPDGDDTLSLGKVKIASYDMQVRQAVMVPVGEHVTISPDIEQEVNNIFLPFGIEWNISIAEAYTDNSWDIEKDGVLDVSGSGAFSMFSDEMDALNQAYRSRADFDESKVYLFVLEEIKGKTGNLLGDMPVSSQFGYLESSTNHSLTGQTVAHELGHGRLQLRHTFSSTYNISEGSTTNLMDYSGGTHLVKRQWDAIHDPRKILAWAQDESEGAMASGKTDAKITFSKLEDTDMGNRYGYDDMGTPSNPDDDHISVKNGGGYTYVKVEIDGKISGKRAKNFDSIFFVSTNPLVIGFDTTGINKAGKEYNLKITGNGITSDTATIQARIKSDSTLLGQIHVNAYKEITIAQTITYISPTGTVSPISQGSISNSSKKYLQYLVANGTFSVKNETFVIDKNNNGRIDDFKNITGKDEYTELGDKLNEYKSSNVILIDGSIYDNWEIGDTVNIGDTYIQLPNAYTSTLTGYVNNYTSPLVLQTPDGKNREPFVIKAISGTRLDISTNLTDPTKTEGFKFQHPVTHIITDTIHVTAGYASTNPNLGAVVTMQKTDELTIQVIVHESMHKYDGSILFDIDKEGNLMHWVSSHEQTRTEVKVVGSTRYTTTIKEYVPIPITIPFNYIPVEQVKTGDGTPMGIFKSQWNDIKR